MSRQRRDDEDSPALPLAIVMARRTGWHLALPIAIIAATTLATPSTVPDRPFGIEWKPTIFLVALVCLALAIVTLVRLALADRPAARSFAVALVGWSFAMALWLLGFVDPAPVEVSLLPCARLVGHSVACDVAQATMGAAYRDYHITPLLMTFAVGYAVIVAIALAGLARRVVRRHRGRR